MRARATRFIKAALPMVGAVLLLTAGLLAQSSPPPAGPEDALALLDNSPRWEEWVEVRDGDRTLDAWSVFPQRSDNAPVVIVLHETDALSDWIRAVADQFAAQGIIAIVPDMLSGKAPGGYGSAAVDEQTAVKLVQSLKMDEVIGGLGAVVQHASTLQRRQVRSGIKSQVREIPGSSGKIGVVGFGWGGEASFQYAATQSGLDAAVIYYATAPKISDLQSVQAPLLALYGGADARQQSAIARTQGEMKKLGKSYVQEIYVGADPAFLRLKDRNAASRKAAQQAWTRTIRFLKQHLGE